MKHPYLVRIYAGADVTEPILFESFDLNEAVTFLEEAREKYKQSWLEVSSSIYQDSGRWDLAEFRTQ